MNISVRQQFPIANLVFLGNFSAHHESWLGSSRTDHAGRSDHAFALTHDLTQLVLQPTRIPDIPGLALFLLTVPEHTQCSTVYRCLPLWDSSIAARFPPRCLLLSLKTSSKKMFVALLVRRLGWNFAQRYFKDSKKICRKERPPWLARSLFEWNTIFPTVRSPAQRPVPGSIASAPILL